MFDKLQRFLEYFFTTSHVLGENLLESDSKIQTFVKIVTISRSKCYVPIFFFFFRRNRTIGEATVVSGQKFWRKRRDNGRKWKVNSSYDKPKSLRARTKSPSNENRRRLSGLVFNDAIFEKPQSRGERAEELEDRVHQRSGRCSIRGTRPSTGSQDSEKNDETSIRHDRPSEVKKKK